MAGILGNSAKPAVVDRTHHQVGGAVSLRKGIEMKNEVSTLVGVGCGTGHDGCTSGEAGSQSSAPTATPPAPRQRRLPSNDHTGFGRTQP